MGVQELQIEYKFTATFRRYKDDDDSGWNFLFMPNELAKEVRANFKYREEGWGRMKVLAKIGSSEWKTSIWFDTKQNTYLLPVKAEIRKKEKIEMEIGKEVDVTIWI
jgi:hypothetical protein